MPCKTRRQTPQAPVRWPVPILLPGPAASATTIRANRQSQSDQLVKRTDRRRQLCTPHPNHSSGNDTMLHTPAISSGTASMPVTAQPRAGQLSGETPAVRHICTYNDCCQAFSNAINLGKHLLAHLREKPFVCPIPHCGHAYKRSNSLAHHLRIHSGGTTFVCPLAHCRRSFMRASSLVRHLRIHSTDFPFVCPYEDCAYSCIQASDLIKHWRIHSGEKPFICPYKSCGRSFTQPGNMKRHVRCHTGEKPFVCPDEGCQRSFRQQHGLTYHLRAVHAIEKLLVRPHDGAGHRSTRGASPGSDLRPCSEAGPAAGRLVCSYASCKYASPYPGKLTRHWPVHSGAKPWVRPQTSHRRAFTQSGHLKSHLRIHSGITTFACPLENCEYVSTHSSNLTRHWRVHSGEKPFVCLHEGCGRVFAESGNLAKHLRIHSGEKPFVCPQTSCRRAFTQSGHLKSHLRIHSGVKAFACPHEGCGYTARQLQLIVPATDTHPGTALIKMTSLSQGRQQKTDSALQRPVLDHWTVRQSHVAHSCHSPGFHSIACGRPSTANRTSLPPKGKLAASRPSWRLQRRTPSMQ